MRLLLFLILLTATACRSSAPTVTEQREQQVQRFQIVITYKGLEGLKRVPYKYAHLRMEMVRELGQDPIRAVYLLPCTAQELDGHLYKLGQDSDVLSAVRYE